MQDLKKNNTQSLFTTGSAARLPTASKFAAASSSIPFAEIGGAPKNMPVGGTQPRAAKINMIANTRSRSSTRFDRQALKEFNNFKLDQGSIMDAYANNNNLEAGILGQPSSGFNDATSSYSDTIDLPKYKRMLKSKYYCKKQLYKELFSKNNEKVENNQIIVGDPAAQNIKKAASYGMNYLQQPTTSRYRNKIELYTELRKQKEERQKALMDLDNGLDNQSITPFPTTEPGKIKGSSVKSIVGFMTSLIKRKDSQRNENVQIIQDSVVNTQKQDMARESEFKIHHLNEPEVHGSNQESNKIKEKEFSME